MTKRDESDQQNLSDEFLDRLKIDCRFKIQSSAMSDPTLSDIDFGNKMAWVTQVGSELPLTFLVDNFQRDAFPMNKTVQKLTEFESILFEIFLQLLFFDKYFFKNQKFYPSVGKVFDEFLRRDPS